jgi:glyceraldehyde 3-phosphate dehydrogenase
MNIIPHSSGAASAVPKTIPNIKSHLDGMALRVPIIDGSITTVIAVVHRLTSADEINKIFQKVAQTSMKSIVEYSDIPLVSSDIIGNPHSCIVDSEFTKANGRLVQVVGWYDNEWGYSCRMVDMIKKMVL